MEIDFIGHASLLVTARGLRILSDPWWRGPCFGAQWWINPDPAVDRVTAAPIDYIYVSHGHHDHFHPGTLRSLDKSAKVLVSSRLDLAKPIRELGFEVIEIDQDTEYDLGNGVKCLLSETHNSDTLFVVDDGEQVCVNLNDALHAAPVDVQDRFITMLKSRYPRIDYLFCGYGIASHFPNCYRVPGVDLVATAQRRQAHFNRSWARIVNNIAPVKAFPFAADVIFLEDELIWANEAVHNSQRPTDVLRAMYPASKIEVFDIAAGFKIADHKVLDARMHQHVSLEELRTRKAADIERMHRYGSVTQAALEDVLGKLKANIDTCRPYLAECETDYRFLIRFRNSEIGFLITKLGRSIGVELLPVAQALSPAPDVTMTTRLAYLKESLSTEYGNEILFVGSGCIIEYASAERARQNIHRELITMTKPHTSAPRSRFGDSSPQVFKLKRSIKKLLGRTEVDLYDLTSWMEFSSEPAPLQRVG